MNKQLEIVQNFKNLTVEELEAHGYLQKAHKSGYICPICGNGSKEDGTGIESTNKNGVTQYYCFGCGRGFDNLHIAAAHLGLDLKSGFKQILQQINSDFNLSSAEIKVTDYYQSWQNYMATLEDNEDFSSLYQKAVPQLEKFVSKSWRGLSLETLKKHNVGFIPRFGQFNLPTVIIPTDNYHYLARNVGGLEKLTPEQLSLVKQKKQRGIKTIFNFKLLFNPANFSKVTFITEGEIDAMSVEQCGFNCIALGGKSITQNQVEHFKQLPSRAMFIVLFDDDCAGRSAADKAVKKLNDLGFAAAKAFLGLYNTSISDDFDLAMKPLKDANEALQVCPEELANRLGNIYSSLQTKLRLQLDQLASQTKINKQNLTISDCVSFSNSNVAVPFGFSIDNFGTYKTNTKTGEREVITHTPIYVSKIYKSREGVNGLAEITYYDYGQRRWLSHNMALSKIFSGKEAAKVVEIGVAITDSRAKKLAQYFVDQVSMQENKDAIPCFYFYDKPGWITKDGEMQFVYPGAPDSEYFVAGEGFDYATIFDTKGDRKEWSDLFCEVFNSSLTARMTLGFSICAPMLKLVGTRNPQLHLFARSGSGKSAVVKFAMSIFGNPNEMKQTFHATQNYLDNLGIRFNDFPVWIDEMQSAGRNILDNLELSIYNRAEAANKGRLTKSIEVRKRERFNGVTITTGEMPITANNTGQGAKARVIELAYDDIVSNELAEKIHSTFEREATATFGHIGRDWVEWLRLNQDTVVKTYDKYYRAVRDLTNGLNYYPAHISMLAVAYSALALFCKMLGLSGTKFELRLLEDLNQYINTSIGSVTSTNGERALREIVQYPKIYFKSFYVWNNHTMGFKSPENQPAIGAVLEDGSIALYPSQFRRLLNQDSKFPNDRAVIKQLCEMNVFNSTGNKNHPGQRPVSINAESAVWMYIIKPDIVKSYSGENDEVLLAALPD